MAERKRQKIVIDTDCGIDDAIALLFALSCKETAEVVAITCCFGNTSLDNVCSNVMRVLTVCGETEIPIYRGCAGPLISKDYAVTTAHGDDGLGNRSHEFSTGNLKESETPASVALINLAKKYPKEINLIAIGPLTNLALAHRLDPTFTENLRNIHIMGGNHKGIGNITEVAEFNFYCDPESAHIVLTESHCPLTLVPWETTMDYGIQWETYDNLIKIDSAVAHFFKRITEYAVDRDRKRQKPQLHDSDFLAAVALLYPESVKRSYCKRMEVECDGIRTRGQSIVLRYNRGDIEKKNAAEIITNFDLEYLNKLLFRMLTVEF